MLLFVSARSKDISSWRAPATSQALHLSQVRFIKRKRVGEREEKIVKTFFVKNLKFRQGGEGDEMEKDKVPLEFCGQCCRHVAKDKVHGYFSAVINSGTRGKIGGSYEKYVIVRRFAQCTECFKRNGERKSDFIPDGTKVDDWKE